MSKTIRWYNKINSSYNPYYFKHELKFIRIKLHREFRKLNKFLLRSGRDIEKEIKTNGWITW